ncbi:hypothetical protein MNV49_001496 [Pseudohyphozyma bogoriensis]|nr:hypothetical protein MNV49_001496 [Pseudohyphozyma bogoriensis]
MIPTGPPGSSIKRCRTEGFAAYAVEFSPFFEGRLAVAGSANFGLVGNGRLSVVGVGAPNQPMIVEKMFDSQDGLYDLAWSESHENQIATASGDGSIKLWDIMMIDFPIRKWHEHSREVFSINWNNIQKDVFASSSWDCSIKIWTPDRPSSILTIPAHTACVYSAIFSPSQPTTLASCSSDGFLKIWDTRAPISSQQAAPSISMQAHNAEVLSLDWNKYLPHLIATGSVDRSIRIHDLRMAGAGAGPPGAAALPTPQSTPIVSTLLGHEYAVRKVAWSPHSANVLASGSYDMTARLWSMDSASLGANAGQGVMRFGAAGVGGGRLERIHQDHTEFVVGLGWSYFDNAPRTLYDKVFDDHTVVRSKDGTATMFIDRHLVHEVTSPQAFEGLKMAGRKMRRNDLTLATLDHNTPTSSRKNYKDSASFIKEPDSRLQVVTLEENVKEYGLNFFGMTDKRQGIVHVIGPEQGFTLPGSTVVCGDSHTSTHGAFGALAFGIGTSEVEHVLATQTILQAKSLNMRVQVDGPLADGVTAKDVALHIIGRIGTAGGTGAVIEFCGTTIEGLTMEGRMTLCNLSIEGGARAGMIAPDETTFKYLQGRPLAPKGEDWDAAVAYWKTLKSDEGAHFDRVVKIDSADIAPTVTWGTSPEDTAPITGNVPDPKDAATPERAAQIQRALTYMGLDAGMKLEDVKITNVFIGSCTNSRIEDIRAAARIVGGRKVVEGVRAMVVPGSGLVSSQAISEGLDKIFKEAGFEWREAGCSMCLGMNPDILSPGQRCASTSNRNFEGRQGPGGRTHLCSPAMAAAAAVTGHLTDVRKLGVGREIEAPAAVPVAPVPIGSAPPTTKQTPDAVDDGVAQSAAAPTKAPGSSMPAFTVLKGIAAPLERANVDTDLIIPARFLKTIKRTGLGVSLFAALRYKPDGSENPDFILNQGIYRNSKILVVAGGNFGCGSSREHAPWALLDFGIRAIIASSYADIFNNNSYKNGNLPVVLSEAEIAKLLPDAKAGLEIEVDLPNQVVRRTNGEEFHFDVDPFRKHCLINGLDDIGLTLAHDAEITAFEKKRTANWPWLDGIGYRGKIPLGERIALDW